MDSELCFFFTRFILYTFIKNQVVYTYLRFEAMAYKTFIFILQKTVEYSFVAVFAAAIDQKNGTLFLFFDSLFSIPVLVTIRDLPCVSF